MYNGKEEEDVEAWEKDAEYIERWSTDMMLKEYLLSYKVTRKDIEERTPYFDYVVKRMKDNKEYRTSMRIATLAIIITMLNLMAEIVCSLLGIKIR